MIEVKNFSFSYQGSDHLVLDHINLTIQPREWLLISGGSGCGKSTLALALAGFLEKVIPGKSNGEVLINQRNIQNMEIYEISEIVFLVQQNAENQFCTLTVKDELAFGLENRCVPVDIIGQRITSALSAVQAQNLIDRRLDELSGGQQQKIAIATALTLQPEVLILDEPTSNLDCDSLQNLLKVLEELRLSMNLSVVIIEHQTGLFNELVSRHIEIMDAKLVESKLKPSGLVSKKNLSKKTKSSKIYNEILLAAENLQVEYEGVKVLEVNHFELHAGEVVSLMGPNGSGKTTMLLSLLGLIEADYQSMRILGTTISGKIKEDIMASAGLVFQNPDHQLFCDSVEEEIKYGPANYPSKKIEENWINCITETFGFSEMKDKHPFLLSYGQKGRLNLASILSYKPRILLLDEVFIGQDSMNVIFILDSVRRYVDEQKASVILVNHMVNPVLNFSDRLIFMENGKIVIDCKPENGIAEFNRIGKSNWLGT